MADEPTLLAEIESFLVDREMPHSAFGRLALNDPHFVRDHRAGRRVWPETEAKVRRFMATYRPTTSEIAA